MSRAQSVGFSPRWLQCSCCVLPIVLFAAVCVRMTVGPASALTVTALWFSASLCKQSLHALVSGRCPTSTWRVALQLFGAVLKMREK
jgi:uncharacterized membrane protein HdeD (DUF308 family)